MKVSHNENAKNAENPENLNLQTILPKPAHEEHKCEICDKIFKKSDLLEWHKKFTHNQIQPKETNKKEMKIENKNSSKILEIYKSRSKQFYNCRIKAFQNTFECKFCDKRFATRDFLQKHVKEFHFKLKENFQKNFQNEQENLQNEQENLQNEQENSSNQEISVQNVTSKIQPTNNRKFCHICNKEFSILENLNNHLKYGNCERNEIKFINKIFDEKTQLPTKDTESASNRDEYFS